MGLKRRIYFVLASAISLAFAALMYGTYKYPVWDTTVYLSNANYFLTGAGYFEILRAPLLPLMIAAMPRGLENFLAPLFIVLFLVSVYFIGSELFDRKTGILASVLVAATPLFILWSPRVLTDVPAAAFTVIAFIFLNRALKSPKNLYAFALFSSLAFLTRYPAAIIFPIGMLYYLARKKARMFLEKETYFSAAAFALPILLWLFWNFKNFGGPFFSILEGIMIVNASALSPKFYYLTSFYETFSLLALPAIISVVAGIMQIRKYKQNALLLLWLLAGYAALSLLAHKEARYIMFLLPAFGILIASQAIRTRARNFVLPALLVLALLSAYHGYGEVRKAQTGEICNENIIESAKFVSQGGNHVMSSYPPIVSYYSGVVGEAFPAAESWLASRVKEKNITYVLASDGGDAPEWAKSREYFEKLNYLKFEKEFKGPCQTIWAFRVVGA